MKLTAEKEWLFENYPECKTQWCETGHDDLFMLRMMQEYAQAYHKAKSREENLIKMMQADEKDGIYE